VAGYRRKMMYRAVFGSRCGQRSERSSVKDAVEGSRTVEGVSDSLLIVQRRPR